MEKIVISVPAGIRYISEWENFDLPQEPAIINKQITGCGFTEWVIKNRKPSVLCSPRKILLENKEEQHEGEVFYIRNNLDKVISVDIDISTDKPDRKAAKEEKVLTDFELNKIKEAVEELKDNIKIYYFNCIQSGKPCKLLTTYDSFRYIKEALGDNIKEFDIVVDEFQSIFTDSKFKSDTELEFLNHLQDLSKVYFVSATPMIDEYLNMLPEFRDLPYYELDWTVENPERVIKPQLDIIPCQRILDAAERYIKPYLEGNFEKSIYKDESGNIQEIESRELVIYVNSVKNICDIIRRNGLTYENTNVLCANTPDNQQKIRKAFGFTKKSDPSGIGSVPKRGKPHKMFTLCTRTVYLGADFYSICARTLILSDANVDSLAVDITLDLPQILGRQRLKENPWKNRATLYFKSLSKSKEITVDNFKDYVNYKRSKTENLLSVYSKGTERERHDLAENYLFVAKTKHYKDDYVAVNTHGGSDLVPVINNLVMVSEIRAFQIQQVDYKDRFTVFRTVSEELNLQDDKIINLLDEFNSLTGFPERMRAICENDLTEDEIMKVLELVPIIYKNYYLSLGKAKIKSLSYRKTLLNQEYERQVNNQEKSGDLIDSISKKILVGNKYTRSEIKDILKSIYQDLEITGIPKALDLEKYFELRKTQITDRITGKRDHGFEILKKKENKEEEN